jgi:hypothetical protein
MKKIWFILLVAMACQPKKSTEVAQLSATITPPLPALISIDAASQLVSNYLQHPKLNLHNYTLGGVFPVMDFTPDSTNEGILMWYCFDAATRQVFMAVENYAHYDTANLPKHPIQPVLQKPETSFTYSGASPAEKDVKTFILSQKVTGTSSTIDNASVARYVNSFDSLMQKTVDAAGESYQKYPFNYFIWGDDYNTFVSWAGKDGFIRYYLAYGEQYKSNRVRIVLTATDKDGNTKTGGEQLLNTGDGQGLQSGWPPPPPIL